MIWARRTPVLLRLEGRGKRITSALKPGESHPANIAIGWSRWRTCLLELSQVSLDADGIGLAICNGLVS